MEVNYNLLAYLLYGSITIYITVVVGHLFHKNGLYYIIDLANDETIGTAINNLLLILYYCLNIGYVVLIISQWEPVHNVVEMINSVGTNSGMIILLLALMHYFNMGWIYTLYHFKSDKISKTIK